MESGEVMHVKQVGHCRSSLTPGTRILRMPTAHSMGTAAARDHPGFSILVLSIYTRLHHVLRSPAGIHGCQLSSRNSSLVRMPCVSLSEGSPGDAEGPQSRQRGESLP